MQNIILNGILTAALATIALNAQTAPAPSKAGGSGSDVVQLSAFEVTEDTGGYHVSSASTATRTNTPLIEIPQTVDIVTSAFWDDRNATTWDESFKYVADVFVRNRYAGGGDTINLRGFQTSNSLMVEGIRLTTSYKRDLAGYDRLEVVKGPASAVQGRAGGTGMLNYLLKKPELGRRFTTLKYTFGEDDFGDMYNRGQFDTNLPLGRDGKAGFRVAGALQRSDDYIKFQETSLGAIYPSFRWKLTPQTELVVTTEFLKDTTPSREEGHGFQVYPYKLRTLMPQFDNPRDPITALHLPLNFNPIGPDNYEQTHVAATTASLTQGLGKYFSYRQAVHWQSTSNDNKTYTAASNVATTIASTRTRTVNFDHNVTLQGDLNAEYGANFFSGHTLAGYNYSDFSRASQSYTGTPDAPFNVINLVKLAAAGDSDSYFAGRTVSRLPLTQSTSNQAFNFSAYLNQGLEFFRRRLLLNGGLRREHDESGGQNLVTNRATANANTWLNSWLYGVTYKLLPQLAIYGVKSLQNDPAKHGSVYNGLPAGDPRNNETYVLQPRTDLQELGVKGEVLGGRLTASINYWQMTQEGATQTLSHLSDASAPDYSKVTEVKGARSEGYEINAFGNVTERFSVIANYMHMNTSQQDTLSGNPNARVPALFAPKWGLNFWGKYNFFNARGEGWQLKGGVSLIGPTWTTLTNFTGNFQIPHVQKNLDAGVGYRWRRYMFDLMVNNAANDSFWITRDQPSRNYRLSVTTQF